MLSGTISGNLEPSGAMRGHLGPYGAIGGHLELFGVVGPPGAIWCHLAWAVGTSGAIWNSVGRHPKPSKLWNNSGSTLKRPPALVKQLPRIITSCGHLVTSRIIWSHLEISGPSGVIWSLHQFFANPRPHCIKNKSKFGKTPLPFTNSEGSGVIWKHPWLSGTTWATAGSSGAIWCHLGPCRKSGAI